MSEEISLVKQDTSGKVIETYDSTRSGEIQIRKQRDSLSYFRKAQLTDDFFEKFRNLFLVVENITGQILKAKGLTASNEKDQLTKALSICFSSRETALKSAAHRAKGFHSTGNLMDDVAEYLYVVHRCQLNHAKPNRNHKAPFNADDERQVQEAIPLMEFMAKMFLQYEENYL